MNSKLVLQIEVKYVGVVYLVSTLEFFLVKVKVSTQSPHSEQRTQQCRFITCQSGAAGVLLVLCLQLGQSPFQYGNYTENCT